MHFNVIKKSNGEYKWDVLNETSRNRDIDHYSIYSIPSGILV